MSIKQNKESKHSYFMRLALLQAHRCLGNTKENPAVGCVIVKNANVISCGFTGDNGRPHAEANAINNSISNIKKSNLYVTLEPCSHYGKTPPCVKKIIKSKIKKVYFSIKDPDYRSFNKSKSTFIKSNIDVNIGAYSNNIKKFYRSYFLFKGNNLPFVTCKLAVSKDFYTINKKRDWITNKYSRGRVHLMRASHDCIMSSSNTVKSDNPTLNCRIKGLENRSPAKIILDNYLKISISSNVIKDSFKYRTIIFYNKQHTKKIKLLKRLGVKTYKIPVNKYGQLNLKQALLKAKKLGFSRIFLESGLKLSHNFFKENLINDLKIFISDKKIKNNGAGRISKYLDIFLKERKFIEEKVNLFGDRLITYKIK